MKTSEVLNTAADLIESRGWGKGPEAWRGGGLCLEGAIAAAMGRSVNDMTVAREINIWPEDLNACSAGAAVRDYLGITQRMDWLCFWNDVPDRTASEVIETLRAAAVIEAAKETADERETVAVTA